MLRDSALLSNHGIVLVCLARQPDLRLRDIAEMTGVTPRAAQDLVNDLVEAGYLERRREGRRNRYLVRGDRPIPAGGAGGHDAADLIHALVAGHRMAPDHGQRLALVLACGDHRYQEPLRNLLAAEGLLARAEVLLWPGGSAALAGPDASRILEAMRVAVGDAPPPRAVLVAHQDCRVPGAFVDPERDAFGTGQEIVARRRQAVRRFETRFGVEPELWFLDERGAHPVRAAGSDAREPERLATTAS